MEASYTSSYSTAISVVFVLLLITLMVGKLVKNWKWRGGRRRLVGGEGEASGRGMGESEGCKTCTSTLCDNSEHQVAHS